MTFAIGDSVDGTYVLLEKVSVGGQGVLWAAVDRRSGRRVAVKIFTDHGPHAYDWPQREIKLLRALPPSEYVVAVQAAGMDRGRVYMVMEWIEGRPLRRFRHPRLEQIQRWSHQICLGLEHIHGNRVVHRDIKPDNVMITTEDAAKLVDFGIARSDETTMTPTGPPIGSYPYMAPERWRRERGDRRTDLYAFGCVLYELLTGEPPFGRMVREADVHQLRDKHLHTTPVAPKAIVSGIPGALDSLTLDLLAKQPDQRPASASEVIARLQHIIRPTMDTATPVDPAPIGPHVDPESVGRLHAADNALALALRKYGSDDLRTLQARAVVADAIGRSGDRMGAIRAYNELIPDYDRVCGEFSRESQEVRKARMNWKRGTPPPTP